jgi:hypothetical protein
MCEMLMNDCSRRKFIGVVLGVPTITIRPGKAHCGSEQFLKWDDKERMNEQESVIL